MSGEYKAILTFDDGPIGDEGSEGASLKMILDTLKKRSAPGVFYVLGEEVKAKPTLTKSILSGGHSIQSHSWSHQRLSSLTEAELTKDLQKTQDAIASVTGKKPTRLRPPYGAGWVGPKSQELIKVAAKLNLTLTGWDVDTNDWNAKNPGLKPDFFSPVRSSWKKLYEKKQSPLDILMHVKRVTALALGDFMDGLTREGWLFTTYPEDAVQSRAAPASETKSQCHIQLFAGTQDGALKKAQAADAAGHTNVKVSPEGGLFKVRVGPYGSKREAEAVLKTLQPGFPGAFVVGGAP